jgi:hypothetical protein
MIPIKKKTAVTMVISWELTGILNTKNNITPVINGNNNRTIGMCEKCVIFKALGFLILGNEFKKNINTKNQSEENNNLSGE